MENLYAEPWLPLTFAFLMGLSILIYVVLDGYDLGVGILMADASDTQKDRMIASIGPFWDANETWLVLGIGLLLVAFPFAHGQVLTALYLPTALMLIALILRGVSFDFRAKVSPSKKHRWNKSFFVGSLVASFCQGYMLGLYIMGFESSLGSHLFAILAGFCLIAGYAFIGACWLIMKTEGELQKKSVKWAKIALLLTSVGIGLISLTTPLVNERIFEKWFSVPNILILAPIPLITGAIILKLLLLLKKMPLENDRLCWAPFVYAISIFVLCFLGLAYSFYPYIIPQGLAETGLTIYDAAASPASLKIILVGALLVLPMILGYTAYAYKVFWGKAKDLEYY